MQIFFSYKDGSNVFPPDTSIQSIKKFDMMFDNGAILIDRDYSFMGKRLDEDNEIVEEEMYNQGMTWLFLDTFTDLSVDYFNDIDMWGLIGDKGILCYATPDENGFNELKIIAQHIKEEVISCKGLSVRTF